jgi:hypothetical protein
MKPPVSPNSLPSEQPLLDVARALLMEHSDVLLVEVDVDYVDMSRAFCGQVVSVGDAVEAQRAAVIDHHDIKIIWRPDGVECAIIFQEVE